MGRARPCVAFYVEYFEHEKGDGPTFIQGSPINACIIASIDSGPNPDSHSLEIARAGNGELPGAVVRDVCSDSLDQEDDSALVHVLVVVYDLERSSSGCGESKVELEVVLGRDSLCLENGRRVALTIVELSIRWMPNLMRMSVLILRVIKR